MERTNSPPALSAPKVAVIHAEQMQVAMRPDERLLDPRVAGCAGHQSVKAAVVLDELDAYAEALERSIRAARSSSASQGIEVVRGYCRRDAADAAHGSITERNWKS